MSRYIVLHAHLKQKTRYSAAIIAVNVPTFKCTKPGIPEVPARGAVQEHHLRGVRVSNALTRNAKTVK